MRYVNFENGSHFICNLNLNNPDVTIFVVFEGELQRQKKLISSERPFKILQIETKIIKIGQTVLEIFNFKD